MNIPNGLVLVTYGLLLVSVLSLWITRTAWVVALLLAIVAGYASGVLSGLAALFIALFAALCVTYGRLKSAPRTVGVRIGQAASALGILAVATLLGMHALPGFHNFRAARNVVLSPGATPYTLYLNFDKTVAGLLILGLLYQPFLRHAKDWALAVRRAAPLIVLNIAVLIVFALALGYLRFDPKLPQLFWLWAPVNLFFTCLSEEALFRGFIQRELAGISSSRIPPIAASGILFGLAHFAGGWTYVGLATLAGLGYAWIFQRTQRIEMSILAHFLLNATHFLLLTYPSAAPLV